MRRKGILQRMRDFNTFREVVEDLNVDTCRDGEAEGGGHLFHRA